MLVRILARLQPLAPSLGQLGWHEVAFAEHQHHLLARTERAEVLPERRRVVQQREAHVEQDDQDLRRFRDAPQLPPDVQVALAERRQPVHVDRPIELAEPLGVQRLLVLLHALLGCVKAPFGPSRHREHAVRSTDVRLVNIRQRRVNRPFQRVLRVLETQRLGESLGQLQEARLDPAGALALGIFDGIG